MEAQARAAGVHAVVGLQARCAPTIMYVRDLIADGSIGEILSTTLVASGMNWGAEIEQPNAYTADRRNGATMLTIPFGHTVDAICQALGEFQELEAITVNRRSSFVRLPDRTTWPMTAADQLLVHGVLQSGATIAVHYRGGVTRGTNLLWEINGTKGDLQIRAMAGHAQMFPLSLAGSIGSSQALEPMSVPDRYLWTPRLPMFAQNVAQVYALLAQDLASGTHTAPGFASAVARHRMIASVERAAASGTRQRC